MRIDFRKYVKRSRAAGTAIGAFNVYTMEQAVGAIRGAEAVGAPIMLQVSPSNLRAIGPEWFTKALTLLTYSAAVPVAIHLDHAQNVDEIVMALRLGFTSVMFDGSRLPFRENLLETKKIVELCRAVDVMVEGELGSIAGNEDRIEVTHADSDAPMTDPLLAAEFALETGVDVLAVAVGNVHGDYAGAPKLDVGRIQSIAEKTPVPLALHGSSGLSPDDLGRCAAAGIAKANFNTDLRRGYVQAMNNWKADDAGRHDFNSLRERLIESTAQLVAQRSEWLGVSRVTENA